MAAFLEFAHDIDQRDSIDTAGQFVKLTSGLGPIEAGQFLDLVQANREDIVEDRFINRGK